MAYSDICARVARANCAERGAAPHPERRNAYVPYGRRQGASHRTHLLPVSGRPSIPYISIRKDDTDKLGKTILYNSEKHYSHYETGQANGEGAAVSDQMFPLSPEGYLPRIADAQVERYLRVFGAVEIAGTKWCGKTWTALKHAASVSYVDEMLALAHDDPSAMLVGERPHVVDEWQRVPAIWDFVRHEVDRTRGLRGAWILTGSSTPLLKDGAVPAHSGAGRIGRVRMRPMSLQESGDSTGAISLAGLFRGEFEPTQMKTTAQDLVDLACRGGWPEAIDLGPADAQLVAREYLRLLRTESVPSQGKSGEIAGRLLFSLARNLGQAATYKTLAADMADASAEDAALTEQTVAAYLGLLRGMYVLEEVPGWVPPARSAKRVSTKPKRYLADPSLTVAELAMSPESLLADWQTFGMVFESLCIRDLMVYASALEPAADVPVRYYRDDSDLEVDAIVEMADGRWAAFEVKTSEAKVPEGVEGLRRLRAKVLKNPRARTRPPEFMAVLTGVSELAHQIEEGIYAIPIRCLGA